MDFPTDRPLVEAEILKAVLAVAKSMAANPDNPIQVQQLANPDSIAINLGLPRPDFSTTNSESFPIHANRFVNRLFRIGVLEPFFGNGKPMIEAAVNPEKASALDSMESVDTFELVSTVENLGDAELHARCAGIISGGAHTDAVVREAVTVVESRLRDKADLSKDEVEGRAAVGAMAFRAPDGKLKYSDDMGVQQGVMHLFQGYFLAIANDPHHQIKEYDPRTVTHVFVMSDYLLGIIEASELRS